MAWVPLNHAPLHWRISTDFELGNDQFKESLKKPSDERKGDYSIVGYFEAAIHNIGKQYELVLDPPTGDIVVYAKSEDDFVEFLRSPFWALGTNCLPHIHSGWRLARHKPLCDAARIAWRAASDQFMKAAFRNICVAVGIRKGDPKRALQYIPARDWHFEINKLPTHYELEDGSWQPLPPECYPGKRYIEGPKIDWRNNSFRSLDGQTWLQVEVADAIVRHENPALGLANIAKTTRIILPLARRAQDAGPAEELVIEVVREIWPDGLPRGLSALERLERINECISKRGIRRKTVSARTVQKALKLMRQS